MKRVAVSVILPSLNVVQYIRECIESVINQSLKEIEIICVDAGSTDGTLEILREYEEKDDRIKIIMSDKKSYGYQMNVGMNAAQGEYIGIVETDDYVLKEMYEDLYTVAKENDADFVKADFYRFTRENGKENRGYHKLTTDSGFYNKLIDPLENMQCFSFLMNTWSGIYKRDFLRTNRIAHNETPGASYQDNGFWFQTFMFARRVYFVNRPYYMNRRDNPNSSVFSKKKVFSICDEYSFIWNRLKSKSDLFEKLKYVFSFACYHAYTSNLNRIGDDYILDFLLRFSEDLKYLRSEEAFDKSMFTDEDWNKILFIMENAEDYYKQRIESRNEIKDLVLQYNKVIIYGAGMVGKRTYHELTCKENPVPVFCFAVSKLEENVGSYMNVPIRNIRDLSEYREDCILIVAATKLYQEEMFSTAKDLGFKNIVLIPDSLDRKEVGLLKDGDQEGH